MDPSLHALSRNCVPVEPIGNQQKTAPTFEKITIPNKQEDVGSVATGQSDTACGVQRLSQSQPGFGFRQATAKLAFSGPVSDLGGSTAWMPVLNKETTRSQTTGFAEQTGTPPSFRLASSAGFTRNTRAATGFEGQPHSSSAIGFDNFRNVEIPSSIHSADLKPSFLGLIDPDFGSQPEANPFAPPPALEEILRAKRAAAVSEGKVDAEISGNSWTSAPTFQAAHSFEMPPPYSPVGKPPTPFNQSFPFSSAKLSRLREEPSRKTGPPVGIADSIHASGGLKSPATSVSKGRSLAASSSQARNQKPPNPPSRPLNIPTKAQLACREMILWSWPHRGLVVWGGPRAGGFGYLGLSREIVELILDFCLLDPETELELSAEGYRAWVTRIMTRQALLRVSRRMALLIRAQWRYWDAIFIRIPVPVAASQATTFARDALSVAQLGIGPQSSDSKLHVILFVQETFWLPTKHEHTNVDNLMTRYEAFHGGIEGVCRLAGQVSVLGDIRKKGSKQWFTLLPRITEFKKSLALRKIKFRHAGLGDGTTVHTSAFQMLRDNPCLQRLSLLDCKDLCSMSTSSEETESHYHLKDLQIHSKGLNMAEDVARLLSKAVFPSLRSLGLQCPAPAHTIRFPKASTSDLRRLMLGPQWDGQFYKLVKQFAKLETFCFCGQLYAPKSRRMFFRNISYDLQKIAGSESSGKKVTYMLFKSCRMSIGAVQELAQFWGRRGATREPKRTLHLDSCLLYMAEGLIQNRTPEEALQTLVDELVELVIDPLSEGQRQQMMGAHPEGQGDVDGRGALMDEIDSAWASDDEMDEAEYIPCQRA